MVVFGLTVVRHGETKYNKEKILQGQGVDEPLSETGFQQASAAGIYLSNTRFTHVFSSDLLRAKQTTDSILRKNQFCKEISVNYDARLRERKYGVAEGKPLTNLKAMAKAAGEQCPSYTPPGGETLDEYQPFRAIRSQQSNHLQTFVPMSRPDHPGLVNLHQLHQLAALLHYANSSVSSLDGEDVGHPALIPRLVLVLTYSLADEVKARCQDFFEYLCYLISHEACLEKQFPPSTDRNDTELAGGSSTASLINCCSRLEFHSDSDRADEVLDANILVVSHGAYMRNWIGYFISNLGCIFPATVTKTELSSVSPNTGISQFIVKLEMIKDMKPQIHCICLNREDHLASLASEHL
ncbi:hypothetical protein JD844_027389 [Phrynosoma platyrhinos]|uniref:Fructose-2,6-bisphosphatase TIGAR n=1 Tax=Phrynosoma platyrhinos TaxID=52577 RepID=A0ABQ7SG83_PHRPL|nr:hypothetical protein JD844_027389 [Phrynosoma platyrhinos]